MGRRKRGYIGAGLLAMTTVVRVTTTVVRVTTRGLSPRTTQQSKLQLERGEAVRATHCFTCHCMRARLRVTFRRGVRM